MDGRQIRQWVQSLERSLGEPRQLVNQEPLKLLHQQRKYPEMVTSVRKSLGLDLKLSVALVNSGGPSHAPAWVNVVEPMPMFGTRAFRELKVTTYFRKDFLANAPFGTVVIAMAHELSHIVLNSIEHELRLEEKAVDLTAMLLGYRKLYLHNTQIKTTQVHEMGVETLAQYGYLSIQEIRYSISLMCR